MNKSYRHGQILKLIRARRVHTQQELADALQATGVDATQVTLSRDIRELGLVKTAEGYRQLPAATATASAGPTLAHSLSEFLLDIRPAQQLLVLRTPPGGAMSLARALDQEGWEDVVGTVAGDDTVLVVTPDAKIAERVRQRLLSLVN